MDHSRVVIRPRSTLDLLKMLDSPLSHTMSPFLPLRATNLHGSEVPETVGVIAQAGLEYVARAM